MRWHMRGEWCAVRSLKVRNLREEEQERRARERENGTQKQELQNEIKRRTAQKGAGIKEQAYNRTVAAGRRTKRKKKALVQKEQMHRSQEQSRIQEADMRYIKGMMERNERLAAELPVTARYLTLVWKRAMQELALLEQAQQIRRQGTAEAAAEITAAESVADSGIGIE